MRYPKVSIVLVLIAVAGCQKAEERAQAVGGKGLARYQGVGIYRAGETWAQLARPDAASDAAAARLDDDDEVIVVIDNVTGELRQCGNLSGHCIGMNPWVGPVRPAPATLRKHAADLRREAETRPMRVETVVNPPTAAATRRP